MSFEQTANILLIDDHIENLIALEAILCGLGQNLVKARSGQEALRCLLNQDFAVILLDVQMPDMDGFETASIIRQRPRSQHTPIIFITAFSANDRWQRQGYALGAVDYLLKPIEPDILVSKVSVFVELFKKTQEIQRQSAELAVQKVEIIREQLARQQAEAASRMKDEFMAIVSHELRTPLNSILGWSKLLAADKLDAVTARRALETISRNAQAQAQLIDDILDVARLMRGKLQLRQQPVNLCALVLAELESIRPLAEAKKLQLSSQLIPDSCIINGDPQRLQQILRNLLSNAIKFTPQGGAVQVTLSEAPYKTNDQEQPVNSAQITISDTGVGITPDFLPHIFEYFRQADSSSTRSHDGLGLGLAIVHQLVELHGGTIHVASEGPGKGTTFTLYLPMQGTERTDRLPSQTMPQQQSDRCFTLAHVSVLVVDDNADNQNYIVTVLRQAGAQVIAVSSGQEAMDCLQHFQPDVLLSDIAMPEEDGYGLLHRVRQFASERNLTIPAIALTAYAKHEDRLQALSAGFQHFLAKPVDPTELIQTVAQVANSTLERLTSS